MSDPELLVVEAPGPVEVVELAGDSLGLVEVVLTDCLAIEEPAAIEVVELASAVIELIEIAEQGPAGPPGGESMPYSKRVDFVGDTIVYKGEAAPGSSEADPVWRIVRITVDGDDIAEHYAGGGAQFAHVWLDRAALSYS